MHILHLLNRFDCYLIGHILRDHAVLLLNALHVLRILPAELRCQGDNQRGEPNAEYHDEYASRCAQIVVINVGNGPISAQTTHTPTHTHTQLVIVFAI